jgi:hypothetical protein
MEERLSHTMMLTALCTTYALPRCFYSQPSFAKTAPQSLEAHRSADSGAASISTNSTVFPRRGARGAPLAAEVRSLLTAEHLAADAFTKRLLEMMRAGMTSAPLPAPSNAGNRSSK